MIIQTSANGPAPGWPPRGPVAATAADPPCWPLTGWATRVARRRRPHPQSEIEGLFTVLMCADCQAARGHGNGPYPVMTRAHACLGGHRCGCRAGGDGGCAVCAVFVELAISSASSSSGWPWAAGHRGHVRLVAGPVDQLELLQQVARRTRVVRIPTVVVFPAPFGPSRPKTSPEVTANDTPSTALTGLLG